LLWSFTIHAAFSNHALIRQWGERFQKNPLAAGVIAGLHDRSTEIWRHTVYFRLNRMRKLNGIDPRTYSGTSLFLTVLRLMIVHGVARDPSSTTKRSP